MLVVKGKVLVEFKDDCILWLLYFVLFNILFGVKGFKVLEEFSSDSFMGYLLVVWSGVFGMVLIGVILFGCKEDIFVFV